MPEMKAELARLEEQQVSAARLFNQNLDGLRKRVERVEDALLTLNRKVFPLEFHCTDPEADWIADQKAANQIGEAPQPREGTGSSV